tara:strand:- start:53 stop:262 length:210 start_codon:yes stop_codon:yes gene_type:complete
MKFKIPLVAIIILSAIALANKEEIKNMFNEDSPVNCEVCQNECPCFPEDVLCPLGSCECNDDCVCPNCA